MSRECMITGKKRMMGNNRSHALNATRRSFEVNIQQTSVYSEVLKRKIKIRATAAGLRTLDHKGGIDAFIMGTAKTKLHPELAALKGEIEAKAAQAA